MWVAERLPNHRICRSIAAANDWPPMKGGGIYDSGEYGSSSVIDRENAIRDYRIECKSDGWK